MVLVALAAAALAITPDQVVNPQADHRGWVSDMADAIDPDTEARIEERLEALYGDLGVEVALVTIDQGDRSPKAFATSLFNRWHLGDAEANNGLLVLMVMDERRLEMETGYGLEPVLPDSWLGAMQKSVMVPAFKDGDYGGGLRDGLEMVDDRLRRSPEEARAGTRGFTPIQKLQTGDPGTTAAAAGLGAAGGALVFGGVVLFRRRERTCPDCKVYMPMLSEVDDDEHLTDAQQTEELLGSVDYQIHVCPQCEHTRTFTVRRWFSGYSTCSACGAKARKTQRVTERAATTSSTGRARITESCRHCLDVHSYTVTIARVSTSSSSSSGSSGGFGGGGFGGGGGGSFGGGSSGGGGAGSSW